MPLSEKEIRELGSWKECIIDTVQSIINNEWPSDETILIKEAREYISTRKGVYSDPFFLGLLEEIARGPDSPRAKTGELQNGLRLMLYLIRGVNASKTI